MSEGLGASVRLETNGCNTHHLQYSLIYLLQDRSSRQTMSVYETGGVWGGDTTCPKPGSWWQSRDSTCSTNMTLTHVRPCAGIQPHEVGGYVDWSPRSETSEGHRAQASTSTGEAAEVWGQLLLKQSRARGGWLDPPAMLTISIQG